MDFMRVGEQMAYPSIPGSAKMPSITERLTFRKKDLESQLDDVNKVLDALTKNPDFQAIFDLVSQVRYLMPNIVLKVAVSGAEKYYWLRITGRNGEIMLDSEEYSSRSNALRAAKRLAKVTGLAIQGV